MKKRYTTASGSVYIIDFDNKTWERKRGEFAAEIRTGHGIFHTFSDRWEHIEMIMPPIDENAAYRYITSTRIEKVEEID